MTFTPLHFRDVRIDVLRGSALLIMILDHIWENPVRDFMPISLGFSDMAEAFFFLSGYVCGIAYGRRLAERGFWACQRRACWRALQLYAVNLLMIGVFIVVIRDLNDRYPAFASATGGYRVARVLGSPIACLPQLLRLEVEPIVLAVLPFYIVMLFLVPALLLLCRFSRTITIFQSIGAYAAVQIFPETIALPEPWRSAWFFNPFAWQLVFVAGAVFGTRAPQPPRWLSRGVTAPILAAIALETAFLVMMVYELSWIPYVGKANLEVLRLAHFAAVLVVAIRFLPRHDDLFWKSRSLAPFATCGRNSLATYCAGALIATFGSLTFAIYGFGAPVIAAVNSTSVSASFVAAWIWQSLKRIFGDKRTSK